MFGGKRVNVESVPRRLSTEGSERARSRRLSIILADDRRSYRRPSRLRNWTRDSAIPRRSPPDGKTIVAYSRCPSCSGSRPFGQMGRPHVTPLVAVWLETALHFTTGAEEQEAGVPCKYPRSAVSSGPAASPCCLRPIYEALATK